MNINLWLKGMGIDPTSVPLETLGLLNQLSVHYESMMKPTLFDTKDTFLEEINEKETLVEILASEPDNRLNDILENEELSESDELALLRSELEQDIKDGLLLPDAPFFVVDNVLHVVEHQSVIQENMANLAKSIVDAKYNQDINVSKVNYKVIEDSGTTMYSNIVCTNKFGIRFKVDVNDILDKLNKIPFE